MIHFKYYCQENDQTTTTKQNILVKFEYHQHVCFPLRSSLVQEEKKNELRSILTYETTLDKINATIIFGKYVHE